MIRGLVAFLVLVPVVAQADHILGDADIAPGKALYGEHCAGCHGTELEGQPDWQSPGPDGILPAPPHDESGHTWHHDSQLLFDYTKFGGQAALAARSVEDFPSGMPGFGDTLSDADIRDILGFIRSTWPARLQSVQETQSHTTGN